MATNWPRIDAAETLDMETCMHALPFHGEALEIDGLSKRFGSFDALADIRLSVRPGELIALLGPSGSGKTSLLRIIAGLEQADRGRLRIGGLDAAQLSVQERRIGFVFQHYALFRHMSVADNIGFGLRVRARAQRPGRAEIRERVEALLARVQLEGLGSRYPTQLSGGQRQRVALARALAIEPRLLLLDEPFGALDARVRRDLRRWLRELQRETGLTTVFVTHDQEEALELADRVVLMRSGRIEQVGSPAEVYARPASAFAFEFLGDSAVLRGEARAGALCVDGVRVAACDPARAGEVQVHLRPSAAELAPEASAQGLPVRVQEQIALGARSLLRVQLEHSGQALEIPLDARSPALAAAPGSRLHLQCRHWQLF
jgi:sulfate/thiosulfate transport system ATP-binding protein